MAKWKLFLTTLPYVLVVIIIKVIISDGLGFEGLIEFSDVALVLTGGIFLIGFMLAGTMADYKESEKIPADLACNLETLEDTLEQSIAVNKTPLDKTYYRNAFMDMVNGINDWILHKKTQAQMYESLTVFTKVIREMELAGVNGSACGKMLGDINSIRKIASRLAVISRTGFLATGYALLEVLIFCIVMLLMISKFKNHVAEMIIISFVSLIYFYMYRLIRDIDDPFEYGPEGETGVSEIPLFPMREFIARTKNRK